jgi:hypothetical protein
LWQHKPYTCSNIFAIYKSLVFQTYRGHIDLDTQVYIYIYIYYSPPIPPPPQPLCDVVGISAGNSFSETITSLDIFDMYFDKFDVFGKYSVNIC